jgi:hypothetical protein
MKKLYVLLFIFLAIKSPAQMVLYNGGSSVTINNNVNVVVNGSIQNKAGSNFLNNGTVILKGNFSNDQAISTAGAGTLILNGISAQTLNGTAAMLAHNVTIDNASGITVSTPLKIDGQFNFINGIVTTSTNTSPLLFTTNATVSTANAPSDASHVNGYLVKEGIGEFTYPLGDGIRYQPVRTTLSSNNSGMQVRYFASDAGTAEFGTDGSENTALAIYNKKEYWNITPLGNAAGNVTLFWDTYNILTVANISDLRVAHKNGNWLNEAGNGTGNLTAGSITSNSITAWSPFTLGSIHDPLPVTLISFSGKREDSNTNLLTWSTANERNFSYFELQHGKNPSQLAALANITGKAEGSYKYKHPDPSPGVNYYRLKMVDNDGTFAYSKIISLTNEGLSTSIYPNPAGAMVNIDVNNSLLNSTAVLYDATGKTMQNVVIKTLHQPVNVRLLTSGLYIFRFADGTAQRFVKE